MSNWKNWKTSIGRIALSAVAVAALAALVTYETAKPLSARASVAAAAAPLDDNSVSALLSLDQAMETLAARVTPAIVNVAVTSKSKPDMAEQQQIPDDMQQFFGPGFGQFFGPHGRPQPQIEHGIGSGVIISPDGYIVTNNHVIDGAVDIRVTLSNRRIMNAKLVGADPLTDLAVIKSRWRQPAQHAVGRFNRAPSRTDRARLRQSLRIPVHRHPRNRQRAQPPQPISPTTRASPANSFKPTQPSTPATPAARS